MFPKLVSTDVSDTAGLAAAVRASLDVDGPSVVSVECAADEIPPFAPFLGAAVTKRPTNQDVSIEQEDNAHVAASA
jgi:acetolactate synthase-1/2/3 large subunit